MIDKAQYNANMRYFDYEEDLSLWAKEICGFEPTPQQEGVLKALSKKGARVSAASGHGVGKTALAAIAINGMLYLYDDVKVLCTAPSKDQIKNFIWKYCRDYICKMTPENQARYSWTSSMIEMVDKPDKRSKRFALGKTANKDKPEALQGGHGKHVLFVVDEATGVDDAIFGPMEGAMTGEDCRVLLISNPTKTSGYFFRSQQPSMKHRWTQFNLSCIESPIVNPSYWQDLKEDYGEESNYYRIRVLGQFPKTEDDALISVELIEESIGREIAAEGEVAAGGDVGSTGDDSAIVIRKGHVITHIESWHIADTMVTAGKFAEIMKKKGCNKINLDAAGIGLGVAHRLRELGYDVNCVNAQQSSSYRDTFCRLRDELWWTAREFFESRICSISNSIDKKMIEKLTAELSSMHWETTSAGKKQMEPKHTRMKDRDAGRMNKLKKSPNCADAFCNSLIGSNLMGLASIEPTNVYFEPTPHENILERMYL